MEKMSAATSGPPTRHGSQPAARCFQMLSSLARSIAPGCQHFGPKVFEECCFLAQIGVTQCPDNVLAPQAQLRPLKDARPSSTSTLVRKGKAPLI